MVESAKLIVKKYGDINNEKNTKKVTFIAVDAGEKMLYEPLEQEAIRRGYQVNILIKGKIVFYCQLVCIPKRRSKLSIIKPHDLMQQHGICPNIWVKENWNNFDIGLLPNNFWEKMWIDSFNFFANTRIGCFNIGWLKADALNGEAFAKNAEDLANEIKLDRTKRTVLYAPSWENDNKQLEFINSLKDRNVNMLIKQYPASLRLFPQQYYNIKRWKKSAKT